MVRYTLKIKLLMQVKDDTIISNVAVEVDALHTWHGRMCHQEEEHIKKVLSNSYIKYSYDDFFCGGCVMGKQHRMAFAVSSNRAQEVAKLVHTDLCRPMKLKSVGGARFMLLFRDDNSNNRYMFCINAKSDVAKEIVKYLDPVEADTGKKG